MLVVVPQQYEPNQPSVVKSLGLTMEFVKSLTHPLELWALLRFKFGGGASVIPTIQPESLCPDMRRCYELLRQTSRSFAAVIQALDDKLRPAICIFYLVLRALDTVEDDMTIPREEKVELLQQFHTNLYKSDWNYTESNEKDKAVLEEFPKISGEFRRLEPVFQEVICDITRRMGSGMCVFLEERVGSMAQWDEYCHYVAGLVGIGLSRLFSASELESEEVGKDHSLANSMGLFLQKTNIIRDYLEDVQQGRHFWPKEAWSQFGDNLEDLALPENKVAALHCLNHLVTNALQHVPDVLMYMSRIRNQSVFNFCAIPQTMAIATLAVCYNNPNVFTGVVKIRKGQAVALMMESTNMTQLYDIMAQFAEEVSQKVEKTDPSANQTRAITRKIKTLCQGTNTSSHSHTFSLSQHKRQVFAGLVAAGAAASWAYWTAYSSV